MRRLYPATLLVSAGAIGYELLLMRMLSIVQWHHFAYMIISLALLGYGASGTFIALLRDRLEKRFETAFSTSALLCGVTMVACFVLGQRVPFNALEIVWDPRQLLNLGLVYLLFFVPFFFAACCIGLAFTCRRLAVTRIYFVDLLGAGLGALLVIGALFLLLPQNVLLLMMAFPLAASVIMSTGSPARRWLVAANVLWLAILSTGLPHSGLDLRISEFKGLSQALQVVDSRVTDIQSSPLGLVTVVESPTIPARHAPGLSFGTRHIPPEQLQVFTDADGMSAITRFDGDLAPLAYLGDMTAALPFALLDRPHVLVLGAGGGSDVLLALYHNAHRVDAVELNPQMTRLLTHTYRDFAGNIYDDPRVSSFTAEARGFVARTDRDYDLIHIGLLDSFGASGAGVQSLNESYIYTVEAIREYLAHTAPDGVVSITRWLKLPPRDSLKLFATAADALRADGIADPGMHLTLVRSWNTTTLLIRKRAFSPQDLTRLRAFCRSRSFDTSWFPGISIEDTNRYNVLARPYLYQGATALLDEDPSDFHRRYKFYIEPATDDRPYFFHFFKWSTLLEVLALRNTGGAALIEWGYPILVATLVQATIAGLLLILLPLSLVRRNWPAGTTLRMGSYFLLLGFAFLFIEIAFIQKFILFLSHPLYSVAVVLSSFLVFAGLGSAWSEFVAARLAVRRLPAVPAAVIVIAIIATLYVLVLPTVFQLFVGAPDLVKVGLTNLLVAPLAFAMGMPFPLGLRALADRAPGFIPWAWGINGFASVASAVLATLLAIEFGFTAVIVLATAFYAIAAVISLRSALFRV